MKLELELTRQQAESLTDLLEDISNPDVEDWRIDLADIVRAHFGMISNSEAQRRCRHSFERCIRFQHRERCTDCGKFRCTEDL